jgi:hypothetical protein
VPPPPWVLGSHTHLLERGWTQSRRWRDTLVLHAVIHRKIKLIDSNAISRYLKKSTCNGTLRQVFICLRSPPILGFCLGWEGNFLGSKSRQIQSVQLLQDMASTSTTQHAPFRPHTVFKYCTLTLGEGGGEPERILEGQ